MNLGLNPEACRSVLVTNANNQDSASKAFFVSTSQAPGQCAAGLPLSIKAVDIVQADANAPTFNLTTWSGGSRQDKLEVKDGVMSPAGTTFYSDPP